MFTPSLSVAGLGANGLGWICNDAGSKSQSSSRRSAEHTESRREILHSGGRLTPTSWPVGGLLSPRTPYRGALIPDTLGMSAPHEALGPVSEAAGAVTENPARLRPDLADPALARSLTLFTVTLTDSGRSSTNMGHSASVAGLGWWMVVHDRVGIHPILSSFALRLICTLIFKVQQTSKPQFSWSRGRPLITPHRDDGPTSSLFQPHARPELCHLQDTPVVLMPRQGL